ncbi:MAG: PKD-like domain-containing protein, partial [Bacteroidota bacterium]
AESRNTTTGCVSATRTAINATINALPSAPTAAVGNAICATGSSTISATPAASSTIDWYVGATGGTVLVGGTGVNSFITPSVSTTTTYYAQSRNTTTGCVSATRLPVTLTLITPPSATIAYSSSSYCINVSTTQAVTITGTTGGTFSVAPSGLSINTTTGAFTPSSSTANNYTVTYTIAAAGGCSVFTTTKSVSINQDSYAISYPSLSYCTGTTGSISATNNAPIGGTYSCVPAGLSINTSNGGINLSASLPGNYIVYYTYSGGCSTNTSTGINIVARPVVTCPSNTGTCLNSSAFVLSGASPAGGTYSGAGVSGGVFNPVTAGGLGTYPITYTYDNGTGCLSSCTFNMSVSNSSINATATPTNTFVYSGNICDIALGGPTAGTQFTWTATANNPSVTGFSNQTSATASSISQQLFNTSATIGEITYTITPTLINCVGNPITVVISMPSSTFCESPGTFQKGSCIIDMGVVPQTYNNGLKPYGLVYQLLNVSKVPVYWAINPSKSFGVNALNKVDNADFIVDGITYTGGAFIIPAAYLSLVQSTINSWVSLYPGLTVRYSLTSFDPPVYDLLTRVPNAVLDSRNGATIQTGFYDRAGIPGSAYTLGGVPKNIANCDDIYVLPHAEPELWTQEYKDSLLNFINNRGWLYSSCRAVSAIESNAGMNFLSSTGLILDYLHNDGTPPYAYSLQSGLEASKIAGDPFMQSIGKLDDAVDYGAETIFLPNTSWRSTTKIAIYDSGFVNNGINYPNNAAILAYGRAFGNSSKGLIVYLAGHDFNHGVEAANVASARIFGNFLLRSGVSARPIITPVSIPLSASSGEVITLSVSIPPSTSTIVSYEWTSDLNGIFSAQAPTTTFTVPGVDVVTICTVQFKVIDACGRAGLYCTTIIINPTIKNNYIGVSQTICAGTAPTIFTGTLPVAPQSLPVTYQWLMSTTSSSAGFVAATGSSTSQNYTSPALTQTTWFRRQVRSNGFTVFSTSIQISVNPGPVVSTQPSTTPQSVCQGTAFVALTVASPEAGVTYQWSSNTVSSYVGTGISAINGATNATCVPSSALSGTLYYFCVITNTNGCKTNSNLSGAISVIPTLSSSIQPSLSIQNACIGAATITPLSVVFNGGISYQWYSNITNSNGSTSVIINGATSASYTPNIVGTYYYHCRVTGLNCTTGLSSALKSNPSGAITIKPLPTAGITNISGTNAITCSLPRINVRSTGGGTYLWNNGLGTDSIVYIPAPGNYTVTVTNNGCTKDSTIIITNGITGSTWTGVEDNYWNNPGNWCGGIPTDTSDVTIPSGTPADPVISAALAKVRNITLNAGAILTLDGQTLQIFGSLTSAGNVNAVNGTIEMKGIAQQSLLGSMFAAKRIANLRISNPAGVILSGVNDTLKLTNTLDFGTSNAEFNANGNLTVVSDASGTARIADMTSNGLYSGNKISGNVTVERYIPNHVKAWQLLATPTLGQTINAAWQEGNAPLSNTLNAGNGTIITSNLGGSAAGSAALGFDVYTPTGATMKTFSAIDSSWIGVSSTSIPVSNNKGYMILVRGDRSVTVYNQAATATKLRTTGLLFQPIGNAPATISVLANKYESVGNPYASAISLSRLIRTGGVQDAYYVWDPKLTAIGPNSAYGLGGFQSIVKNGTGYTVIPGGGSYPTNTITNIESGQAFLVRAFGTAGTVSFAENQKSIGGGSVTRNYSSIPQIKTNLSVLYNGNTILIDGVLSQFDEIYSNSVDETDVAKITSGTTENISILSNGVKLVAEQRTTATNTDTIFYNLGQMRRQSYQLELNAANFSITNVSARLVDNFTGISTRLNADSSTIVPFTITTDLASAAANRFYIVFDNLGALPVTLHSIAANQNKDKSITVSWKAENEVSIDHYEIERSADGRNFETIATALPKQNNGGHANYTHLDNNPYAGSNFYRVKAKSTDGRIQYTSIVKISSASTSSVLVYPNPVEDKIAQLHFVNVTSGDYQISVYNSLGQRINQSVVTITGSSVVTSIKLDKHISSGNYKMEVLMPDGTKQTQNLIIK